jgi:hypothetical protein
MKRISSLEQQIRGYINKANLSKKYSGNNLDEWNTLCVAMDTLGDSCLALEHYEASGIGQEAGEKYLKLYGLLQAVILQQDSIRQIYKILLGSNLRPNPNSAWRKIRKFRNLTAGHPIEMRDENRIKRCFVSRATICHRGFQLIIWNKGDARNEFRDCDLNGLYQEYKLEAVRYLETILETHDKQ